MSKKRPVIQVNEEKLKMMMAGDIPIKADPVNDIIFLNQETEIINENIVTVAKEAKNPSVADQTSKNVAVKSITENIESNESGKSSKRKKIKNSYVETFLCKSANVASKQLTVRIDETNYTNTQKLLIASQGLSISNFINNILAQHFDSYDEEIRDFRQNFIENYK